MMALTLFATIACGTATAVSEPEPGAKVESQYDVVVYGGTSAGIIAAIQAKKMGKSVVVLEQTIRVGGLTTGGLGATDCFWGDAIGGLSRSFYEGVYSEYHGGKKGGISWKFAPSDALKVFHKKIKENDIEVIYEQLLDREKGVKKDDQQRITSITMMSGETYNGKAFVDATYEGDLMAAAGVDLIRNVRQPMQMQVAYMWPERLRGLVRDRGEAVEGQPTVELRQLRSHLGRKCRQVIQRQPAARVLGEFTGLLDRELLDLIGLGGMGKRGGEKTCNGQDPACCVGPKDHCFSIGSKTTRNPR